MAKKDNHSATPASEFVPAAETVPAEEPVLYESEAYGSPQLDEGATTTVMKPVGIGGPVPIVAPKHNTIQLQPIVVPLAVVPYMTQDSDILRTDGGRAADGGRQEYAAAVEFSGAAEAAESRSRASACKRVFSAVAMFMSALMIAAFLVAYFKPDLHADYTLFHVDIIGQIMFWAEAGEPLDYFVTIVNAVAAACAVVVFFVSLAGVITGRYARKTFMILFFVAAAAYAAEIVYEAIEHTFDAAFDADILTMLSAAGLAFLLSAVFAAVCIRREDREDTILRSHSEI